MIVADDQTPNLSPFALELRDAFKQTYRLYHNDLPKGFRDFDSNADFDAAARILANGDAGYTVYVYGRAFCRHLLPCLEGIEAYELLPVLRRAIEAGETLFDNEGYLEIGHIETTTPGSMYRGLKLGTADLLSD